MSKTIRALPRIFVSLIALSAAGCSQVDPSGNPFVTSTGALSLPTQTASNAGAGTGTNTNSPFPDAPDPDGSKGPSDQAPPSCDDNIRNGQESDIDCGGPQCAPCPTNKRCREAQDCHSKQCAVGRCLASLCTDGIRNGLETDVDCGGPTCPSCGGGSVCAVGRDCRSGQCNSGRCTPEACNQDKDCAHLNSSCSLGHCDLGRYICVAQATQEGQACDSGRACVDNEICHQGKCQGGQPRSCQEPQQPCTSAFCNAATDRCETKNKIRWFEGFRGISATNSRGWKAGNHSIWRIDVARPSIGCQTAQDPALDHTKDGSNMVLGTMIGDCLGGRIADWDCVYSPDIDLSDAPDNIQLKFWRHLQTYAQPFVSHKIIARREDGSWATLLDGFSEPIWDTQWTPMTFSVKGFRHAHFSVAVCLTHLAPRPYGRLMAGWTLDDFSLAPSDCDLRTIEDHPITSPDN